MSKSKIRFASSGKTAAVAVCLIGAVFTAPAAWAGFQTIDLSGIVNAPFAGEINGSTFPTGNQTYNGVPVNIANVASSSGYNNFWTGGGSQFAAAGTYSVAIPFNDVMNVTNVYTMINTLWGQVGTTGILGITFTAGNGGASYSQDLIDGSNVRDYNLLYGDAINGTTTKQAFANGLGQVLDMQDYTLPSYFLTDGLAGITLTENGGPNYEKAMFNALTLQTAPVPGGTSVPEPSSLALFGIALLGLMVSAGRRGWVGEKNVNHK